MKTMTHAIDPNIKNTNLEYCIDEYVRKVEHRQILKEKWFSGMSLMQLADKHSMSESAIKDIVYGIGDSILTRAAQIN